mgnify:CR=1 FL=1
MLTRVVDGVRVALTQVEIDSRQAEIDSHVEPIPHSVTKRQAWHQLRLDNLLTLVQPAIDAITDEEARDIAQIFWDHSERYERTHEQTINIGTAIGLDSDGLDDMFKKADLL